MTALLEVQNLVKQFPTVGSRKVVQAVNGVDFTIDSGETLALVGESGSGKTTIGRAVVGLIEATAGEIRFSGKPMGRGRNIRSNDIRGRIQLVFQEPAESLNPRIRVGETIAEPLRYLGLSQTDRDARMREVVARLGLAEGVLDQFPADGIPVFGGNVRRPSLERQNRPFCPLETSLRGNDLGALGHRVHFGHNRIGIKAQRGELLAKLARRSVEDALVDRIVELFEFVPIGALGGHDRNPLGNLLAKVFLIRFMM